MRREKVTYLFKHLILALFSMPFCLHASDAVKGIIQFEQNVYNGARQNWSVSSGKDGKIYFANHTGLLEFDGTNWKLNNLPNRTILRTVKTGEDSSIVYSGGYMELGYWNTDKTGNLVYHSLNSNAEQYLTNNIEFWNIATEDDFVYYQAFSKVLTFHNDSVYPVKLEGQIFVMNRVGDKILVSVRNNGIFEIKGDEVVPYIQNDLLNNKTIKFLIPFQNDQLLIGTAADGILIWDGNNISEWNPEWTNYFIENELNRGFYSEDGKVIIGTLVDGLVVFDTEGNLKMKANMQNGLPNNTILGIDVDEWQNIWLALDIGIAFIPGNQGRSFAVKKIPGTGAIYSTAVFENKIYLGTNQGLFVKSLDLDDTKVSLVPETQDQIWELKIIGNELLVGHNQGSFSVKNGKTTKISSESGAFNFIQDPYNPNLVIQSTYNSLLVYKKTANGLEFRNRINGFTDLIRYIEFDHLGNIWASHMHRGIYKIHIDDDRREVLSSEYFGQNTFGKDHSIHVFSVEKRIVFTTGEQLYTFDDLSNSIIGYDALNKSLGKYASSHRIVSAPNHHYWFIGEEYIGLFSITQNNVQLLKEFPSSLFNNPMLVEGFENIMPIDEYSAILCLQNGIALLDAAVTNHGANIIKNYAPIARHIKIGNNRNKSIVLPLNTIDTVVKHNFNSLTFNLSFPLINELPISYRYFLEGLDQEWSQEMPVPEFSFERLPRGKYNLKVKAVDLWGNESQVYLFSFEILPPFAGSRWAIFLYNLIFISALLLFRSWGIRQTRKKEQRQHEAREQELIRLRNDKLRNEVSFKSKELANSTMAIIRKNEFLIDLKNIIRRHKNELGSRYPDKYFNYLNTKIDENISSRDDWQIFENNFERAHEQFFKKMKDTYPELTSGDLQLCAYLRMNLSSKEIAPLLGISVRGVENHRYRLRKKLNLEHNESLTDTIFSI